MNIDEKSEIVSTLIKLAENSKLNNEQKDRIVEILDNMDIITETQRERFIMYYGLNTNGLDFRTLDKIARIYECSTSAVRFSVVTVKQKLVRLEDEFKIIIDIVKECTENN
ncbi:MAG: hypothetical protein J6J60_05800 [Clostridia bacterium]|nr:hypothetical protein [Clostridia bacterium]